MFMRKKFQFRIVHALLMMIPLGLLSVYIGWRIENRPIDWVAYSENTLEYHLAKKDNIMLFTTQDWNVTGKTIEVMTLETRVTRRWVQRRGVVAIKLDCTNGSVSFRGKNRLDWTGNAVIVMIPGGDFDRAVSSNGKFFDKPVRLIRMGENAFDFPGAPYTFD